MFLLGFILYETLHFIDLGGYFLSHVWEVFNYNLFKYFLRFFLFFFFLDPYNLNIGAFNVFPEVSETDFHFFF